MLLAIRQDDLRLPSVGAIDDAVREDSDVRLRLRAHRVSEQAVLQAFEC